MRVRIKNSQGSFGRLAAIIEEEGGRIGAIDTVRVEADSQVRDITVYTRGTEHAEALVELLRKTPGIKVIHSSDRTFLAHLGGKIEIKGRIPLKTREDLSMAYTPGVARICTAIHKNPDDVYNLTIKKIP